MLITCIGVKMPTSRTSFTTQMKTGRWMKYYSRAIAWWNGVTTRVSAYRSWEMKRKKCASCSDRNLNCCHCSTPTRRARIKWWTMIPICWMTSLASISVRQVAWSLNNKRVAVTPSPSRYFRTMMEVWLQDSTWPIITTSKRDTRWLLIQTTSY